MPFCFQEVNFENFLFRPSLEDKLLLFQFILQMIFLYYALHCLLKFVT